MTNDTQSAGMDFFRKMTEAQMEFFKNAAGTGSASGADQTQDARGLYDKWIGFGQQWLSGLGQTNPGYFNSDFFEANRNISSYLKGLESFFPKGGQDDAGIFPLMNGLFLHFLAMAGSSADGKIDPKTGGEFFAKVNRDIMKYVSGLSPMFGANVADKHGMEDWAEDFAKLTGMNFGRPAGGKASNFDFNFDASGSKRQLAENAAKMRETALENIGKAFAVGQMGQERESSLRKKELMIAATHFQENLTLYLAEYGFALAEASKLFQKELESRGGTATDFQSQKDLTFLCMDKLEEALGKTLASKEYAGIQAALLNSSMKLKAKQNEIVEESLKETVFATKSEVDAAYAEIHGLKKTVRELKAEIDRLKAEPKAAEPVPKAEKPKAAAKADPVGAGKAQATDAPKKKSAKPAAKK